MNERDAASIAQEIALENREWIESLDYVYENQGAERVLALLRLLQVRAQERGVSIHFTANTPYINTIPVNRQPAFPGSREIERRIKSLIRWNAMAMVVRANRQHEGIGGHISTFASSATLYEVGFNHFFRAKSAGHPGDIVFFQGHAAPGIYARAFLEGRISQVKMEHFRRELADGGGLSSYPHPYLMPEFWQFPTVSMGLSPIMAIYQARFNRYMEDRGLKPPDDRRVWAFLGDGETDEPETLGAITLAARERLDNLIFVINCNLQRLDGPVRGNGKIIQELEASFRGAGWNAIKVIWGMTGIRFWRRMTRAFWSSAWKRFPTVNTRSTRLPVANISARIFSAATRNWLAWWIITPTSNWPSCVAAVTIPTKCLPLTRRLPGTRGHPR